MQKVTLFAGLMALFFLFTPATRGQDAGEVERLRKDNELLKKENELLKKEIELLKREAQARPGAAKDPGTDEPRRGPGRGGRQARPGAAKDPETEGKQPRTKATIKITPLHEIDVELVKCSRGQDPTLVTFKFALQSNAPKQREMQRLGTVAKLALYTADGEDMGGQMTGRRPTHLEVGNEETTKFQINYRGVDPDITEIGEVRVVFGPAGRVGGPGGGWPVRFYRIKIETEK